MDTSSPSYVTCELPPYPGKGREGVLPINRLMRICRTGWGWGHSFMAGLTGIDFNGVAFSLELLEWDHTFLHLGDQKIQVGTDLKIGRFLLH